MKSTDNETKGGETASSEIGNLQNTKTGEWISVKQASECLGVTVRAVKKACKAGRYTVRTDEQDGRRPYLILLSSLPETAQAAWFKQQYPEHFSQEHRHEVAKANNQAVVEQVRKKAETGELMKTKLAPVPIVDQAIREELTKRLECAPTGLQRKAHRSYEIVRAYTDFERAGVPHPEIMKQLLERFGKGVSSPTVWRLREAIRGQDQDLWPALLLPKWKGNTHREEISEEAWNWIKAQWGTTSKPALKPIWRRARDEEGPKRGWTVPGYEAVKARIDALPGWQKVLLREGERALNQMYPAQKRDYSALQVHQIWVADGRKADVFTQWEDGSVSRPILVAWQDVRTRVVLGWEIGKTESADLVRLAFKRAAEDSRALPKAVLMDNGRGFASKLLTGGVPNRYRFKVKDEDIPGILTLLVGEVIWATPAHGQAKPIESWFKNLGEREKSAEFVGAYCGNRPAAKPEEFQGKAVPIAQYREAVRAEIRAFHERSHRGDGMDGLSPRQVYESLIGKHPVKQPTAAQLRLCLMAAEAVRLDRKDHSIRLLGNRYWHEALTALNPNLDYVARFNPEDATEPVALYLGEKFLCEVPMVSATGFRDQQRAKDHNRARSQFVRSRRDQAKAMRDMAQAEEWSPTPANPDGDTPNDASAAHWMNGSRVVQPIRPGLEGYIPGPRPDSEEEKDFDQEEIERRLEDLLRRQAAGKR